MPYMPKPGITIQHKQNQRQDMKDMVTNKSNFCGIWGKNGHDKNSPSHLRKKYCQAYNSKCNHCHKPHHQGSACQLKQKNKRVEHSAPDPEMPLFDCLCITYISQNISIASPLTLDHHVFNNLSEQGLKTPLNLHHSSYQLPLWYMMTIYDLVIVL